MRPVSTLPPNDQGRDFVVGDIHGVFELLDQALIEAKFDPLQDRVISLGDLIDRGPHSYRCMEFLIQPWFHAIRGNHEALFLEMCDKEGNLDPFIFGRNIFNGMGWLENYSQDNLKKMRAAFAALPVAIEIPTPYGLMGFVHAEILKGLDWNTFKILLEAQDPNVTDQAIWGRERIYNADESGVAGISRVFFGHTPLKTGAQKLGNCYYMDTGAVFSVTKNESANHLTFSNIAAPDSAFGIPEQAIIGRVRVITASVAKTAPLLNGFTVAPLLSGPGLPISSTQLPIPTI